MELGSKEINVRQYLGWFQFKGADQQKKVSVSTILNRYYLKMLRKETHAANKYNYLIGSTALRLETDCSLLVQENIIILLVGSPLHLRAKKSLKAQPKYSANWHSLYLDMAY
jgi:hypothetical protein